MDPAQQMTFIPIVTPVHAASPSRCPHCREIEDIKRVCNHCGHVYMPRKTTVPMLFFAMMILFAAVGVLIWVPLTLFMWAIPIYGHPTLIDVVLGQIQFVIELMHRIW